MKKQILIAFCFSLPLTACDKFQPQETSEAQTNVVEKSDKVVANFDVDSAETEKFKQELLTQFPMGTNGIEVEKAMAAKGFDCGPDPTKKEERACTNAITKDKCVVMSIVRTSPYLPDGAQIIKACNVVN